MIASGLSLPAANPWLSHAVMIRSIEPEVGGVATYHLEFHDDRVAAGYQVLPGQFNMLYLPGIGEIPISVSGEDATRKTWAHTIRVAGNVTRALAELGTGACLGLRGPYGSSWPVNDCAGRDVVLVAGGIGLAPLRPAIRYLLNARQRYGRLTLLYGARTPDTLLYQSEFDAWTDQGLHVVTTVDRSTPGWLGNVGVVTLLLDRLRPLVAEQSAMLVCGPDVMMRYVVRSALARGIGSRQIWLSLERNMQCAVGLCGHCQLGPEFVCKDGPVFRHDVIAPYLGVEAL
jgi:NAD(P)H-flavin reductase